MPIVDRRELEFDADALLLVAVSSSQAIASFGLPAMQPVAIRFYPLESEIGLAYGTAAAPRVIRLSAVKVGALLVSYCIRSKIPMPRKATKGVRVEGDRVFLEFEVHYPGALATALEGRCSATPAAAAFTWVAPDRIPVSPLAEV